MLIKLRLEKQDDSSFYLHGLQIAIKAACMIFPMLHVRKA